MVVLVVGGERAALGVHTWIEGYLGPVYRRIVEQLANAGYRVANARRRKDGLMKFLTSTVDVDVAIGSFGMRRTRFQDFQEPTLPDDQAQAKGP